MAKNKYYVVWEGKKPGIYESWEACRKQVQGYSKARYKGFPSKAAAEEAFQEGAEAYLGKASQINMEGGFAVAGEPDWDSISVDAACSGNPGIMEYQGVNTKTGEQLFYKWFKAGTNNVGEFLAIVHALAWLKEKGSTLPVYTDSQTAMGWVVKKTCRSTFITRNPDSTLIPVIRRAERWLENHSYSNKILKWDTQNWGEIPADFGRK